MRLSDWGQTRQKPKDLSVCDREERGRGGEGAVCMCERDSASSIRREQSEDMFMSYS